MRIAMAAALALSLTSPATLGADGPSRGTLLVLNKSDATASLVDPTSGEVLATLPTGTGPHEADVSPDGRTAVVCNYGAGSPGNSLTVIDVIRREVVNTIDLGDFRRPHGIQYLADGRHVLVTVEAAQATLLVDIHEGAGVRAMPTGQQASHMVVLGPDQRRAFIANISSGSVSVVDVEKGELVKLIKTDAGCEGIALHPNGKEVWTTNRAADNLSIIDTGSLEVTETIPSGGQFPIRIKFTPDGKRALVSNANSGNVVVFDTATHERIETIAMKATASEDQEGRLFGGRGPVPVGILVQPDGKRAYVANTNADIVTVIDLEKLEIAGRLRAGKEPDGMAWVPAAPASTGRDSEEG